MDYYSHTAFEITSDQLGAQATVCGGGRYDGLIGQLGGAPTPPLVGSWHGTVVAGAGLQPRQINGEAARLVSTSVPDVYLVNRGERADVRLSLARSLQQRA